MSETTTSVPERPAAPSAVPVVPRSSFDFLEGRFRATAKVRTMNVLTAGALAIVVAAVLVSGAAAQLQTRFAQADLAQLKDEHAAVRAELSKSQAAARGATEQEVSEHVKRRAVQAVNVLQNQADYISVLEKITSVPGVTVENVQLEPVAAKGDSLATLSITGTAPDVSSATSAIEALSDPGRFPFLAKGDQTTGAQCSGSAATLGKDGRKIDACTWGWQGTLRSSAQGARSRALASTYGVEPSAKPAPQPTRQGGGG